MIIFLLSLLTGISFAASPNLIVRVQDQEIVTDRFFSIVAILQGTSCEEVKQWKINFPKEISIISDSEKSKPSECQKVYALKSKKSGNYILKSAQVDSNAGVSNALDISFDVQKPIANENPKTSVTAVSQTKGMNLNEWIGVFESFVSIYLAEEASNPYSFSIESCRPLTAKYLQLLMGRISIYPHYFKFANSCDLNGLVEQKINAPFSIDLKVKNVQLVDHIKGTAIIKVLVTPDMKFRQITDLTDGEVFYQTKSTSQFSVHHERLAGFDLFSGKIFNIENKGTVHVKSFLGESKDFNHDFSLQGVDTSKTKQR